MELLHRSTDDGQMECRCYPFGSGRSTCSGQEDVATRNSGRLSARLTWHKTIYVSRSFRAECNMAEDGSSTAGDIARCGWKTSRRSDLFIADKLLPLNLEYLSLHLECLHGLDVDARSAATITTYFKLQTNYKRLHPCNYTPTVYVCSRLYQRVVLKYF